MLLFTEWYDPHVISRLTLRHFRADFIEKNLEANYAVRQHGRGNVANAFKKMIEDHNPNSCMLPDNAESACEAGNLCAFACKVSCSPPGLHINN